MGAKSSGALARRAAKLAREWAMIVSDEMFMTCSDKNVIIPPRVAAGAAQRVLREQGATVNIETHMEDVLPIAKELVNKGRTAMLFVIDNGPDFNPRYN